jgi:hypothetical protein
MHTSRSLTSLNIQIRDGVTGIYDGSRQVCGYKLGNPLEITWDPTQQGEIERNAPKGSNAFRMIGDPHKILGRSETALIQYYKIDPFAKT